MRHGSLFSGYGGIDRAIADVFGAETAWVSDVDSGACGRGSGLSSGTCGPKPSGVDHPSVLMVW